MDNMIGSSYFVPRQCSAMATLQVQVHSLCHSNPSGGLIGVLHPGFYPGGPILRLLGRVEGLPYPPSVYLHLHPVSAGWQLCSLWYLHLRTSFYLLQTIIILHIPGHSYRIDSYESKKLREAYNSYAKPAGISYDTLSTAMEYVATLESDKDAEGKTVSGSMKAKYVAYIQSMGLTPSQQKAMWLALKSSTWSDKGTPWE